MKLRLRETVIDENPVSLLLAPSWRTHITSAWVFQFFKLKDVRLVRIVIKLIL